MWKIVWECDTCHGRRTVLGPEEPCPNCRGERTSPADENGYLPCLTCGGVGVVPGEPVVCPGCDGKDRPSTDLSEILSGTINALKEQVASLTAALEVETRRGDGHAREVGSLRAELDTAWKSNNFLKCEGKANANALEACQKTLDDVIAQKHKLLGDNDRLCGELAARQATIAKMEREQKQAKDLVDMYKPKDGAVDNALVAQKNKLLEIIRKEEDLGRAVDALELMAPVWNAAGYAYKIAEIRGEILALTMLRQREVNETGSALDAKLAAKAYAKLRGRLGKIFESIRS